MTATVDLVLEVFPGAEVIMTKRPCKLCGAEIVFGRTKGGKPTPLDAKTYTAWWLDETTGEVRPFKAHRPHWSTCPKADEARKRKQK